MCRRPTVYHTGCCCTYILKLRLCTSAWYGACDRIEVWPPQHAPEQERICGLCMGNLLASVREMFRLLELEYDYED